MPRLKGTAALLLLAAMGLFACDKEAGKSTGKVLARVNGQEITASQLDAELLQASSTPEQGVLPPNVMRKQALEALIDRQLLLNEALHNKIDRDPKVLQVIDRFRTQAVVQAYLDSRAADLATPSKAEIAAYFRAHPELFAQRKVIDIEQLAIAPRDFSASLKAMMDEAKSLEQVAGWLDSHGIGYVKTGLSYTTADLPPQIVGKLPHLGQNRLFVMQDGEQDLLCVLKGMRDSPVAIEAASAQIERHLFNRKMQEAAATEIAHLRTLAKLDYVEIPATQLAGDDLQAAALSAAPAVRNSAAAVAAGK
jgi:peptidyl-prolyl cis-trans isomerase C